MMLAPQSVKVLGGSVEHLLNLRNNYLQLLADPSRAHSQPPQPSQTNNPQQQTIKHEPSYSQPKAPPHSTNQTSSFFSSFPSPSPPKASMTQANRFKSPVITPKNENLSRMASDDSLIGDDDEVQLFDDVPPLPNSVSKRKSDELDDIDDNVDYEAMIAAAEAAG